MYCIKNTPFKIQQNNFKNDTNLPLTRTGELQFAPTKSYQIYNLATVLNGTQKPKNLK